MPYTNVMKKILLLTLLILPAALVAQTAGSGHTYWNPDRKSVV